jgi:methylaspartate mutase sigma subunit
VSSLPCDSHTWGLVVIDLLLRQLGHTVHCLGPCPPAELIAATCRAQRSDLLVLSTTNGHGQLEAPGVIRRLRAESGLRDLRVIIGGKLSCLGEDGSAVAALREAGADAVFDEAAGLAPFVDLVRDLADAARGSVVPVAPS